METDCYRFSTGSELITLPLKPDIKKVYVEVTTICNFSCITCIRHSWGDELAHMLRETFEKLIADCRELPDLRTVHFGGFGEPLTHPDIIEMIAACKARGYQVEMITNGSLLAPEVAAALIDAGLDWLFVSLDGPDPGSYNKIRPGASYDDVVNNIKGIQQLKAERHAANPAIGIEFVATRQNFAKLPAMRKLVDELKARRFVVTNILPYHEAMRNDILYDQDVDINGFGADSVLLSVKTALDTRLRTQRTCRFVGNKALAVTYRGDVSPCYAFMHSYDCYIFGRKKSMIAYSFGNVHEHTLKEIWTQPRYATFRWTVRNAQYPSCTDCRQVDGCDMARTNEADCWGNQPSCGDCLWARELVVCP